MPRERTAYGRGQAAWLKRRGWLTAVLLALFPVQAAAKTIQVAVASNFRPVLEVLASDFERRAGHQIAVSYGSTGKQYAQIVNGAPFDLFLAADVERPLRLEAEGFALPGSRFTYAIGRLVLWSPRPGLFDDGSVVLREGEFRFLAIANPRTAPYGLAAEMALRRLGVWETLQRSIVRGENIGQAFAYVRSGNADLGLVALSQVAAAADEGEGSIWMVPEVLHEPIEQQAVLLRESKAARAFLDFLRSDEAAVVIRDHGYALP